MSTINEKVEASAATVSVSAMTARTRNNTHWSLDPDPEPDYSDWTIVLGWKGSNRKSLLDEEPGSESESEPINKKRKTSNNNTQCQQRPTLYRYSIHRNLVGPKSDYFSSVFLGSEHHRRYTESNTNESFIQFSDQMDEETFHAVAGKAFQIILNHCYRNEDTTTAEKETGTGTGTTSIRDNVPTEAQTKAQANEDLNAVAPGLNKMNAPIVICLCDYFQIDSLIKIAKYNFMRDRRNDRSRKDNINVNDLIHIYEWIKYLRYDFNAFELETYVIDECLDDPSRLLFGKNENNNNNNNNHTVADVADFRFWRLLFTEYYKERSNYVYSENLVKEFSLALVSYLKAFEQQQQQQQQQQQGNGEDNDNDEITNPNQNDHDGVMEVLDGVTFQQLTDVSAFRVVSQHAALELLRFEELYNNENNNENENENEQHELTNLQERCVTALDKSSWQNQDEPEIHHAEEDGDEEEEHNNNNNSGRKRTMTLIDVSTLREKLGHLKCTSLILQSLLTKSISTQQKLNTQTLNQHDSIEHLQRQLANSRRRNREMRSRETAMYTRQRRAEEEEEESASVAAPAPAAAAASTSNNDQRTRRIIVGASLRGGAPPFRDEMFASLRPRINRRRPPPAFRAEYNNMPEGGEEEQEEDDDDSSIEEEIRM